MLATASAAYTGMNVLMIVGAIFALILTIRRPPAFE